MQKRSRDDVQAEAHAAHDEDYLHVADLLERDEAIDRLEEDADSERQQEGSVEEGAEKPSPLPAKGKVLAKLGLFRELSRVT